MATTNKIIIGVDDQIIELTGADKEAFLADRAAILKENEALKAEFEQKQLNRISAISKLKEIAGLSDEEVKALTGF